MHIKSISVRNFRLLACADVSLVASSGLSDEDAQVTTVIVGPDNCGKTSFMDLFRRFQSPSRFELEDFSRCAQRAFLDAHRAHLEDPEDQGRVRAALPFIELRIVVADGTAQDAVLRARFELAAGKLEALFGGLEPVADDDGAKATFLAELRPRVGAAFERTLQVNARRVEWAALERQLALHFIGAREQLSDLPQRFHARAGVHLAFVEHPEAHLCPPAQEVFIHELNRVSQMPPRPVQFVVTTRSPRIANHAPLTAIRSFRAAGRTRSATVKDLGATVEGLDREFVHRYLKLTGSELLFADHAILVDGTTERLLLPAMIRREGLSGRHGVLLEVGAAHAQRFFGLLDFLELPTLVVTDIDALDDHHERVPVAAATRTANAAVTDWFADTEISPGELLSLRSRHKLAGARRLAYPVPERDGDECGRTFEEAFILANPELFETELGGTDDLALRAAAAARTWTKSAFALFYAIECPQWRVPRYLSEGLQWLRRQQPPAEPPGSYLRVKVRCVTPLGEETDSIA
ncbi:AAA family ATPase [Solirubrobacter sp. CPCC 204708]|uniref:AAA family ATPase n=1 Tax=Solirubrobacter deserti TaxID=2282478 RepID=A0ABT4RTW4_9ACTN|nr:AAA family ATPase [Solirubrobacter deserti]MBE2318333.1 AAA family ATPase [Solirubrobacter deserti]MDA0141932.1 AAA family ATPase [Solirubrobacter deserti]